MGFDTCPDAGVAVAPSSHHRIILFSQLERWVGFEKNMSIL